jgi:hypothetical protein
MRHCKEGEINKRKAKKIGSWLNYEIGFSGCGSTGEDPDTDWD